jgi:arabinogalactan endo-1,4-beta-galactosidase
MIRFLVFTLPLFLACSKSTGSDSNNNNNITNPPVTKTLIRAADLSALPDIESKNISFYNSAGQTEAMLQTLKNSGVNTVRIRLWKNPATTASSLAEVTTLSNRIKQLGLKTWITVHYSDTWADPGQQTTPQAWQSLSFTALRDSMTQYTRQICTTLQPDYIQIGNEINSGLLFPHGNISTNESQFLQLLSAGTSAVRQTSPNTKIMIHFAGINGADWFFNKINTLNYDIIALSYYPIWHGKDLNALKTTLSNLALTHNKTTIIAETAYPFTLAWNDWTNNILGLPDQLHPQYPATPQGQKDFLRAIKTLCLDTKNCIGFCYWGGELVAFNGPNATNGSPWENQALYDFGNKALPALSEFGQ